MNHFEKYCEDVSGAYEQEKCIEAVKHGELSSIVVSDETGTDRIAIVPESDTELWLESFDTTDPNGLVNALEFCLNLNIPLKLNVVAV